MDYSTEALRNVARVARARWTSGTPGKPWTELPIGQRVCAIYREMRRIEADHACDAEAETAELVR